MSCIFHSKYASIYYRFRDIAAYCSKIATPLYLSPTLGVKPSELCNNPCGRKTRMMGLSCRERISMIRSAVLIQITRVTDRQTDGRTDGIGVAYTRYSILSPVSSVKIVRFRHSRIEVESQLRNATQARQCHGKSSVRLSVHPSVSDDEALWS